MAHQTPKPEEIKWKLGSKCELFVREHMKWQKGVIIATYCNETGEWIKVRCDHTVYDVLHNDPYLRQRTEQNITVPVNKLKELHQTIRSKDVRQSEMICKALLKRSNGNLPGTPTANGIPLFMYS